MDVTFHEEGKNKIATYILTYEEGQSPDKMEKIYADLAAWTVILMSQRWKTPICATRSWQKPKMRR